LPFVRRILRISLPAALLLGVGALAAWDWRAWVGDPPEFAAAAGFSHADCRRCHEGVFQEWEQSYHARAFTDDNVQAAFRHFGFDRQCQSCHAPVPVLVAGPIAAPELRTADTASGVNCLSCHAAAQGRHVAARRTIADAPCRPLATPELTDGRSCGACHTAIHKDWRESRYFAEGRSCQSCHMPPAKGRPGGVSHVCLGGHDVPFIRSGAMMDCRQEGAELVVTVTNHATGHNFPGERHNRSLLVEAVTRDADGQITLARQQLIKGVTPFRGESSAERIRAGDLFVARFPVVALSVAAKVRLLYKPFPWQSDREAVVVHEADVSLQGP
jgi:hypothetical protein